MDGDLEMLLAVIGTGVALAALIMGQLAGLRREMRSEIASVRGEIAGLHSELRSEIASVRGEIAELRQAMNALSNRVARLEGMIDMIRMGMQLSPPADEVEEAITA